MVAYAQIDGDDRQRGVFRTGSGDVRDSAPVADHRQAVSPLWPVPAQVAGVLLIGAGLVPVAGAFVQFARAGGTPLPLAPTQHLVVAGFHRYVRNPIYLGSLLIFAGEALLFGRLSLLVYAAVGWAGAAVFVRWYEEPALARRFGAEYEAYRSAVPAWRPRLRPWTPGGSDELRTG